VVTRNIVLVGFMGTGKSTVGKWLATSLGWRFADSDEAVIRYAGDSISEIFCKHGEAYFRLLESQVLKEILAEDQQVLATGGGVVLAGENRACMLENGFVIALNASPETIIRRVSSDQSRPLLQGDLQERVYALLEQRKHAYDFAHATIDTSDLTTEQIVKQIVELVGLSQ
jgi:shikimate kinase